MKKLGIFAIALVALALGVAAMGAKEPSGSMEKDTMTRENDAMTGPEDSMMEPAMAEKGAYNLSGFGPQVRSYSSEIDARMLAESNTVILFFAATWCPTCQATYKDFQANSGLIPMGTIILFVNYDKESALKMKYGITYQHTFVVIGPGGEKKMIWTGTSTVSGILAKARG